MRKLFYTSLFVFALASCFENYALTMERALSKEDQALERMPEYVARQNEIALFVPEGYKLFWNDEFDAPSLNTDNWTCEIGRGSNGWGNSELQYYTDRPENVDVRKDNFLLLNLAVGGNFPGIHDINKVTALKNGPAEMEVDYVRVFQKK